MLTATLVIPMSAYLQRSFTSRALFLSASLFFTVGTGLIVCAPSLALVLVGRVLQVVGNGIAILASIPSYCFTGRRLCTRRVAPTYG